MAIDIREARLTTRAKYRQLITMIVRKEDHDPVELTRLAGLLNRNEREIAMDCQDLAADLANNI